MITTKTVQSTLLEPIFKTNKRLLRNSILPSDSSDLKDKQKEKKKVQQIIIIMLHRIIKYIKFKLYQRLR